METRRKKGTGKSVKFRRARLRRFLFTHGPHRLTRGRTTKRHLSKDVVVREIEITSEKWPVSFDGMRIGHVSDFHWGDLLPMDRALQVVELLAEQQPNMVACTGDVVDLHVAGCEPLFNALGKIDSTLGNFFVLGNHDELEDESFIERVAKDSGMIVLRNESLEVTHNSERLVIAGVNWARTMQQCSRHVNTACDESVHLLLSHNPKSFRQATHLGIPLTLAGHTHGGQIAMKNRPNANFSITHKNSAGVFKKHDSQLFVTTGVGAWFPLRVNCPAEIAIITVRSGSNNNS